MGLEISRNHMQETCFIVAIIGVVLAITATALRFISVRLTNRKPSWDDWFSVLATFFFVLYVIPLLYLLTVMNGKEEWTPEETVRIKKAGYSMGPQFCMQQLFAKLSILWLYYRLFSVNEAFLYCVWALGIIQTCWSIATYLAHYLECIPTAKLWDPSLPGHCISSPVFLAAGETPNSLVDFAMIGLAIWMVQSLRIKMSVKIKLYIIFIMGGFAGIIGFVKIGYGFSATRKSKIEVIDPIWATVQQTCSVICCCAPFYKPLVPDFGFFAMIQSFTNTVFTRSRSSRSRSRSRSNPHPNKSSSSDPSSVIPGPGRLWNPPNEWMELDGRSSRKGSATQILTPV